MSGREPMARDSDDMALLMIASGTPARKKILTGISSKHCKTVNTPRKRLSKVTTGVVFWRNVNSTAYSNH